jgi:hypothetical protein
MGAETSRIADSLTEESNCMYFQVAVFYGCVGQINLE